jgi:hypothetical protein
MQPITIGKLRGLQQISSTRGHSPPSRSTIVKIYAHETF